MDKIDDLGSIIRFVHERFFINHKITSFGKFHWITSDENHSVRFLSKTGRELKGQNRRHQIDYFFNENFEISEGFNVETQSVFSHYYHLLISNIDENDLTFYVIGDNCVGPKLGEVTRYKFQMGSIENHKLIRLVEEKIIAVR